MRLIGLMFLSLLPLMAEVSWPATAVEGKARVQDGRIEATFVVYNSGPEAVRIMAVDPGCGCGSVIFPEQPVAAGSQGQLVATYTWREERGPQRKFLRVTWTYGALAAQETQLMFTFTIVPDVRLSRNLVYWRKGAAPLAQNVSLILAEDAAPCRITKVSGTPAGWQVDVAKDGLGLSIGPDLADTDTHSVLQISTDHPHPAYQHLVLELLRR